ncbi:universal stress protein [Tautonia sociabilis]|uniref:Universal stress protein UspA n=1 Tax=Tautonia sociabilis TaxID=2080755 RepID=A0A432MGL7_9BACT|nr:universal stress protein [Tautonia sociabilis]RUL85717.1 universal stress protein UspA [Tautonia sociabilis]
MEPFKKLLVVADREVDRPSAPELAARLASRSGASVTIVGVVPELPWYARPALHDPEGIERAFLADEQAHLEELAQPIRARGVPVEVRALRGRPATEVVREATRGGFDLLIKDVVRAPDSPISAADRQILRACPCPVWLSHPRSVREGEGPGRMLALVDPAPLGTSPAPREARESVSHRILDLATALAESEGYELIVAHVWDAPAQGLLRNTGYTDEQIRAYVDEVHDGVTQALDTLLAPYRNRLRPDALRLLRGLPTTVIPRLVTQEGIDLIVMGTMARSGIAGLVIGNTAEALLGRVPCSVLAVKPSGFVSPVAEAKGEERPAGLT